MKKRKILIILLVFVVLSAFLLWGNRSIVTTEHILAPQNLPESFDGFRIVQVSDLHNTDFGGKLIEKIRSAEPDIIVVTGDMIDYYSTDFPVSLEFAEKVSKIAPVYYVSGNHESRIDGYEAMKVQLEKAGIIILENETVQLSRNGEEIDITGIDDVSFFNGETVDFLNLHRKLTFS
jgi:predicted MPP superfamily phosphohydrolase